jgi:hypothetical protein
MVVTVLRFPAKADWRQQAFVPMQPVVRHTATAVGASMHEAPAGHRKAAIRRRDRQMLDLLCMAGKVQAT